MLKLTVAAPSVDSAHGASLQLHAALITHEPSAMAPTPTLRIRRFMFAHDSTAVPGGAAYGIKTLRRRGRDRDGCHRAVRRRVAPREGPPGPCAPASAKLARPERALVCRRASAPRR